MRFIIVDVEGGPAGGRFAGPGCMGEFGAVLFDHPPFATRFHGKDDSKETMQLFVLWLTEIAKGDRIVFVSDNPAYDWQHINWALWNRVGENPFGHSARRIGDYWAGTRRDWSETQGWKKYRRTLHDHNPVNDAVGNAEALWTLQEEKT
jgi:hypothetical protein